MSKTLPSTATSPRLTAPTGGRLLLNDFSRHLLRRLRNTAQALATAPAKSAGRPSEARPAYVAAVCSFLVYSLLLSACTSTRPVVKIGLLAPFEGLYRQSGYEALAAMRAALADHQPPNIEVLPLALDTSAGPVQARRAAAKLLRDDSVVAVIGPLLAPQVSAVSGIIAGSEVEWHLPLAPRPPDEEEALVRALLEQFDGLHIVQAGLDDHWPFLAGDEKSNGEEDSAAVAAEGKHVASMDGVLWLGDAPAGANFLTRLRLYSRTIPFWTTSVGGDRVFSQLLSVHLDREKLGPVYWALALDGSVTEEHYLKWAASHQPGTPTAFAVYLATQRALGQIVGIAKPSVTPKLAIFRLDLEGSSHLVEFVSYP